MEGTAQAAGMFAQAGAQILSAIFQNNQANRARADRLAAGQNLLDYVDNNNLPDGYLQNAYQILLREYLGNNQNYQNQHNGLQDMFYSGIGDYRSNFDKINTPNYNNPVTDYLRQNLEQNNGQLNDAITSLLSGVQNGGRTENNQALFDTFMQHGSMANPYIRNLVDIGGYMMQNGGMTPYTQNAADVAGYFLRNAGMDGNTQNLYDAGFQNRDTAAQGLNLAQQTMGIGNDTLGFGRNLISDTQRTGGWDANGQAQFQLGMNGINGMQNFFNQDPASLLGATGQQAISGLMNNPYTQQGFDTTQGVLNNFLQRPNISQNDQNIINASIPGAFGINPMQAQNMGIAQGIAGQDVNALPDWFGNFLTQGNNLMSQIAGMGGQQITGGGGGSVGYTPMSRDLGPVDPLIQQNLERALQAFQENPLLSNADVVSFAKDTAAGQAQQAGMAAIKKAAAMGGPAPTVASGGQMDSAIRSFAADSMRSQSEAMKDALMKNSELRLARSGQESDLAKALAAIKAQREDLFGRMNIADANNATQASVANAQLADSAAGRSLQAQIANASNQQAMAKLQAELFSQLMGNASTLRGQNVQGQVAGVGSLADIMNAISGSQKNYLTAMSDAAGRGQSQYNTNAGAITDLTKQLSAYGGQNNDAMKTILDALGGAAAQQTSRGNNMMDNYTALMTGAGSNAASRYGDAMGAGANIMNTGMSGITSGLSGYNGAMKNMNDALGISQGALGIANDRLGQYSNIFKATTDDATARMGLGANMTSQGLKSMNDFLSNAAGITKQQQDYALGLGNIASNLANTRQTGLDNYGTTALGFANNDLGNRQLMNTSFNNFLTNLNTGIGNNLGAWQQSNAPYAGILGQQLNYLGGTQGLLGNYAGLFGGR